MRNKKAGNCWSTQPTYKSFHLLCASSAAVSQPSNSINVHRVKMTTTQSSHWAVVAQDVNTHLMCNPTIWQSGFNLPRQQWSLLNHFRTEQENCGACRRNVDLQTLICVLVARPRRCPILSNPVP